MPGKAHSYSDGAWLVISAAANLEGKLSSFTDAAYVTPVVDERTGEGNSRHAIETRGRYKHVSDRRLFVPPSIADAEGTYRSSLDHRLPLYRFKKAGRIDRSGPLKSL